MNQIYLLLAGFLTILLIITIKNSPLPFILKETFATLSTSSGAVTEPGVAPLCPPGFRFFTDREGKSMCCNGKIDFTEGRCAPRHGKSKLSHVCALGGNTIDEFGVRSSNPPSKIFFDKLSGYDYAARGRSATSAY